MIQGQINNPANLTKLPIDLKKQSYVSNRLKVQIVKDENLTTTNKKDKQESKFYSIYQQLF